MAKLTKLYSMLLIDIVKANINLYMSAMELEKFLGRRLAWGKVKMDDDFIMLTKAKDRMHYIGAKFTSSFYITTSDIDVIWKSLKHRPTGIYVQHLIMACPNFS